MHLTIQRRSTRSGHRAATRPNGKRSLSRQFRFKPALLVLPLAVAAATCAFAARPTDPAKWPAVKDVYSNYFLIGVGTDLNAANYASTVLPGENSAAAMTLKHFDILTPGNAMKPEFWNGGSTNPAPTFLASPTTGLNANIAAANARGLKVMAHTLLWHNQSALWPAANVVTPDGRWETPWDYATAKTNLEYYIRTVAGHFDQQPRKVYQWDVVNEAMKDNPENPFDWRNSLRTGYSPEERPARWAQAYSKGGKSWDYMYDAFFYARQNTTAILNYNDFNDTERESKAGAIASMVKEFNERYAADSAAGRGRILLDANGRPRPLVEVIGTQGHLDMRMSLDAFEKAIKTYLAAGVNVELTELDVAPLLGLDKGQRIANGTEMNDIFMAQGVYYAKMFSLLKEYAVGPGNPKRKYGNGVSRVTWWSMTDPGYHTNGYLWSGVGQPKEAYWAVVNPEQYLAEAGLPTNGVTATFNYGGEIFRARTWGGKSAAASVDINVPAGTSAVTFTANNVSLPAGFAVESIKFNPLNCVVTPSQPCHVTVNARGPEPTAAYRAAGVENTATYVLNFGQMSVKRFKETNSLDAPLTFAEVRFSDGVTPVRQFKTYYGTEGLLKTTGENQLKPVAKHTSSAFVTRAEDLPVVGAEKAWKLAKRIEPGRTYMVVSADSVFQENGETKAYALTNRSKPATTATASPPASPESLSRTPVILRGDTLVTLRNPNGTDSEPALSQDNLKFVLEESKSPAAGPYSAQDGFILQSFIHGTNVYPHVMFRGNGASGTVVNGQYSLITRQTNGQEGSQIAEKAADQAVWFNTPIDPKTGTTKLFMFTGRGKTNQHYVLKEVDNGTTPNRDSGNAISQRQGATGGFIALQAGSPEEGTSVKLYVLD